MNEVLLLVVHEAYSLDGFSVLKQIDKREFDEMLIQILDVEILVQSGI